MAITLRDESAEDQVFLLEVYTSTRATELALVPWNDEQKQAFVAMQFKAQHFYYREKFPTASYQVILADGERVGRIYVLREEAEMRILDLTLLPQHRNRSIGSSLIRELLAEAAETSKVVQIWVEQFNPALTLFERLGFSSIREDGFNYLLEWRSKELAADNCGWPREADTF